MNVLQRIGRWAADTWNTFRTGGYELLIPFRSSSDYPLNSSSILTYAPIWHSTCKIGGHMAQAPRLLKRVNADESIDIVPLHSRANSWQGRLNRLLNLDPNGLQTHFDLIETVQKDAIISGNGRIAIVRQGGRVGGEPIQLVRLSPETSFSFVTYQESASATLSDVSDNGTFATVVDKWHAITTSDGKTTVLHDDDVIHIKGLQHDGLTGIPLYHAGRDSIGGGKTAEAMTNRLFSNDGIPGLILEAPFGVLNDRTKASDFLTEFRAQHSGRNAGRTGILRFGVTAKQLAQENRAAQLLENRQFSRDEAWLWTGDVAFYEGAGNVYKNANELTAAYKADTLGRWCGKWQAEMTLKLLTRRQQDLGWFLECDLNAIMRGTLESLAEVIATLRPIGTISEQDSRRLLGMSPARKPGENYGNPNTTPGPGSGNGESDPGQQGAGGEIPAENGDETQENDDAAQGTIIRTQVDGLLSGPETGGNYPGCVDRDRWIYEQHAAGLLTMTQIIDQMPDQNEHWDLIGTIPGLRKASHRYADHHGLARVNRSVSGAVSAETA